MDGDGGVDDDAFTVFEDFDVTLGVCVLFDNQGGNVGLDSSSADTDDDHGDDETGGVGGGAGCGDGGQDKDQLTEGIDESEDDDGLVTSKILISNNSSKNRGDITPVSIRGDEIEGHTRIGRSRRDQSRLADPWKGNPLGHR